MNNKIMPKGQTIHLTSHHPHWLDSLTNQATSWIGSTNSLILHTIFFIVIFGLYFINLTIDTILLILTTVVSLEAIYLSIFIQRSVNHQKEAIAGEFDNLEEAISQDIDETEAALIKDLDDTEKNISADIDETEAVISAEFDELDENDSAGANKLSKSVPESNIQKEIRLIIREELANALKDKK